MRTPRSIFVISLGLLIALALACKFSASTANISSLKVGKDKTVTTEASTFGPNDIVYAVATIGNSPGKVKVKGRLVPDNEPGAQGPEDTVELPGSGTATFTFTPLRGSTHFALSALNQTTIAAPGPLGRAITFRAFGSQDNNLPIT